MDGNNFAPTRMPLHLLEEITNGFSKDRKVGAGSYGSVYKGEHQNGETIAVKLLHYIPGLDDEHFEKEYLNLASLHHRNIVRLVGYSYETRRRCVPFNGKMVFAEMTKRALCFEYMHNGSLDKYLSDEFTGHDWHTRYAIIKGISQGVKYLHEELQYPMYHLDIKPANVLLDENMVPKLADFGLSRLFGGESTQVTKSAIGTHGYVPPEYIDAAVVSNKFDVFSLGVVIIKIMTGPTGYFRIDEMSPREFVELVHANWMKRLHATSVYLVDSYSEQVKRCIEIALSCLAANRHKRPSIGLIVSKLNETETTIQSPDRSTRPKYKLGEMSFNEHHLLVENANHHDEIDRISSKYVGKPMAPFPFLSNPTLAPTVGAYADVVGSPELLAMRGTVDADKKGLVELAVAAMEELVRMARMDGPLWTAEGALDEDEYTRMFWPCGGLWSRQYGIVSEGSRDAAVVIMTPASLVEILMDVNQYAAVFSSIVSRAATLEVLSTGVAGCYDGALQVMSVELQVPSPLVPMRESYFVRYCKRNSDGNWAVADISLDTLHGINCRRRPSGCLIQEAPKGYSKVTWVEHVEVVDRAAMHNIYTLLVNSGLAFGARRWVGVLGRQCKRLASAMARNIPTSDIGVITSSEGRKSMLKLAERMVVSFFGGLRASSQWSTLPGSRAEDVQIMIRKSVDDPGCPRGIIHSASSSFWLPVPPKRVFDYLRGVSSRSEWDILCKDDCVVQKMAHTSTGHDHGDCVSLLRFNNDDSTQRSILILQESCTDASGSYVIYAPVDDVPMNVVLNGGNPDYVPLLPSGFAILPDSRPEQCMLSGVGSGGSLLTVAFQVVGDLSLESGETMNSLIAGTVKRIKAAVSGCSSPK